jgi:hypothetical protein
MTASFSNPASYAVNRGIRKGSIEIQWAGGAEVGLLSANWAARVALNLQG